MLSRAECLTDLSKERVAELTDEEVEQVKNERMFELEFIRRDIFAFLPYVKIQEPDELAAGYILWPHLVDFYKQLRDEKLIDLIKAKQIGVSWALAIQALWEIYNKYGWNVLELSKGDKEAHSLLAKSRVVYNNLPKWMQIYKPDPNSTEAFGFSDRKSKIVTYPSTETAGIGETAGRVIHDESDFHEYYEINLSHTRATVADSPNRKLVSVSTVDKTKPDSYFKNHWKDARDSKNGFKALFYGYDVRPDRGQEFYDLMVKENEATPWVVDANYPRTAAEALSPLSAQSCFNKDRLQRLWDNATEPIETRQGFIHIFCPPVIGTQYGAGADVGEGRGLDYSPLTIIGRRGLISEVCAIIYSNEIATDLFAYEIDKLCREYFIPKLAVENNSIGVAVLNKLVELGYPNLYSSEVERKNKSGSKLNGNEKMGWTTGESNKYTATMALIECIDNGSLTTRYKPQIKEMMEYQWVIANGRWKPAPTGKTHGDTIISLMLANEMIKRVGRKQEASMYINGAKIW